MEYKYSSITEKIIRACMNVHTIVGNGFQEVICQRALALEMESMEMNFAREFTTKIYYREKHIGERRIDFLIERIIAVEKLWQNWKMYISLRR